MTNLFLFLAGLFLFLAGLFLFLAGLFLFLAGLFLFLNIAATTLALLWNGKKSLDYCHQRTIHAIQYECPIISNQKSLGTSREIENDQI